MSRSTVHELFVERWNDAVEFVSAFREFEERGLEQIANEAVPAITTWTAEQGYQLDVNRKYGEFSAHRKNWVNSAGDPVVRLAVGGVYPNGIAKVDDVAAPYQWVYLKLEQPARSAVAEQLRSMVGNEWLDDDVTDRAPLGRYLRQGVPERIQLFTNPKLMAEFVTAKFLELFALEGVILKTLPSLLIASPEK